MKNYNTLYNNYLKAKKGYGICDLSNTNKYSIYGVDSLSLINRFTITNLNNVEDTSFFTIMLHRKKYLCECLIIKQSNLKYLIITDNTKVFKLLNRYKRKYNLVTVTDMTKAYCLFSFHGDKTYEYFKNKKSIALHLVKRQNYTYYMMLSSLSNKYQILDHFKALGFIEISMKTYNTFLNSHNVITDILNIPSKYKSIIYSLYKCDNFDKKISKYTIKQFEATKNFVNKKHQKIYNSKRRKIGYIHNFYRIDNKKYPYLLSIINKDAFSKITIIKPYKEEILLKEYQIY